MEFQPIAGKIRKNITDTGYKQAEKWNKAGYLQEGK